MVQWLVLLHHGKKVPDFESPVGQRSGVKEEFAFCPSVYEIHLCLDEKSFYK